MNSPMTTKELLALVGKWRGRGKREREDAGYTGDTAHDDCADELAPIATALCAEVEAKDAKLAAEQEAYDGLADKYEQQTREVEALRKDAERWRAYERELPDSADSTRVFLHGVAVLKAAKLAAKEPK